MFITCVLNSVLHNADGMHTTSIIFIYYICEIADFDSEVSATRAEDYDTKG
jgi:hypothetical protein